MNKKSFYIIMAIGVLLGAGILVTRATAAGKPSAEVYQPGQTAGPSMQNATVVPTPVDPGQAVTISATASDVSGINTAIANVKNAAGVTLAIVQLYDDGKHSDGAVKDGVYANTWNVGNNVDGQYPVEIQLADALGHPTVVPAALTIVVGTGYNNVNTYCYEHFCNTNSSTNTNTANTNVANTNTTDTTPPTVSITDPATGGATLSAASYSVVANAVDAESLVTKVEFYLDAETTPRDTQNFDQPSGSHDYTWVLNLSGITNGDHTLKAIAYNGVGLTATATRAVVVSIITAGPPFNVNITAPATGATYASTATIGFTITAQDDTAVTKVDLFSTAGGGAIQSVITSTPSVIVNMGIGASSITYLQDIIKSYAMERSGFKLPFVKTAKAAELAEGSCPVGETEVCSTSTSTASKGVYATAYDDSSSTNSPIITLNITSTSTNCICQPTTTNSIPSTPTGA